MAATSVTTQTESARSAVVRVGSRLDAAVAPAGSPVSCFVAVLAGAGDGLRASHGSRGWTGAGPDRRSPAGVAIALATAAISGTAVSDERGTLPIRGVADGPVELTFRLLNFTVVRRTASRRQRTGRRPSMPLLALSLSADVVVTGTATFRNIADIPNPAESLVGIASAASQGAITAAQLEARPVMRPGEVLETVPGLIVSQHSGEGKANQYYLRGFNLDHGTDFSTTIAGVPVNTPTGAHAHGYTDISFLIPELVSGVQFKKGPYFADEGDFSAAGAANINYVNRLDAPIVRLSAGNNGWGRVMAARLAGHRGGHPARRHRGEPERRPLAARGSLREGERRAAVQPRRSTQRLLRDRHGLLGRLELHRPGGAAGRRQRARFPASGIWTAPTAARTSRQSVAADFQRSTGPSSLRATAFVLRNRLNLFSNFTYFLDDPVNGDQFEQAERRTAAGGRVTYRRLGRVFGRHAESALGVAGAKRLARPGGPLQDRPRATAVDDARRPRRPDDDRRLRAERDRVDALAPDHDGTSSRRLPLRRHRRATRSTPGRARRGSSARSSRP